MEIEIVPMDREHWEFVKSIYQEGIATGNATFEISPPDWDHWNRSHFPFARLAAWTGGELVGWAALSAVSSRCVYAGVAEVSIYVAHKFRGHGVGRRLLEALVQESEINGIWMLQAGIFPENAASLGIHEKCGFRIVGLREKLGKLSGYWRDVVLMERRSRIIGID